MYSTSQKDAWQNVSELLTSVVSTNGSKVCYLTFLWKQFTKLFEFACPKSEPVPLTDVLHQFCHRPAGGDKTQQLWEGAIVSWLLTSLTSHFLLRHSSSSLASRLQWVYYPHFCFLVHSGVRERPVQCIYTWERASMTHFVSVFLLPGMGKEKNENQSRNVNLVAKWMFMQV